MRKTAWLVLLSCLLLPSAPSMAQDCVPAYSRLYGELFDTAQKDLPEGKSLVDAVPRQPPAGIVAAACLPEPGVNGALLRDGQRIAW